MKKALFLLPGAIALLIAGAPFVPALIPTAVAQSTQQPTHGKGWMNKLNLSDTQKAAIKKIRESSRQQMEAILSQDQKDQMKLARQNHQRPKLNLSDDQKTKLKAIHDDAERQILAQLNEDQKQQYQQLRQQMRLRHQQRQQQQQAPSTTVPQ
jgi:exopolysaccharide biosynthesis protein